MTLKELITPCWMITMLDVEVRTAAGKLQQHLIFGAHAYGNRNHCEIIEAPINIHDNGSDMWKGTFAAVPNKLLNSEVTFWEAWPEKWNANNGRLAVKAWVLPADDKQIKVEEPQTSDDLPGQMDISQFLGD